MAYKSSGLCEGELVGRSILAECVYPPFAKTLLVAGSVN